MAALNHDPRGLRLDRSVAAPSPAKRLGFKADKGGGCKINGKLCYLGRAVDHEGEALETVVTVKQDKAAALKFLKRIMKKYGGRGTSSRGDERDRQR